MSDTEITKAFNGASNVVQANITALLQREQVGLKKYGCTCDRQDLNLPDWLNHALEETLDKANYLRAAIHSLDPDIFPAKNTLNHNTLASNAEALPQNSIPRLICSLLEEMDSQELRATVNFIAARNPTLIKLLSNLMASAESTHYLKHPGEQAPPEFMLRAIGSFNRDEQRELLAKGLEHATCAPVTFRKIEPQNKNH